MDLLEQRANKIIENRSILAEKILAVYKKIDEKYDKKRAESIDKLKPEELLYDIGFPNEKDQQLMTEFHQTDDWKKKVNFIGKFDKNNAVYSYFATRIIYEETGEQFGPILKQQTHERHLRLVKICVDCHKGFVKGESHDCGAK